MYMQARYYDPVIGRFYSNDPVGYTAANPVMSFNRYMYVNNNPYKYNDPNGEFLNFIIGAAVGAIAEAAVQVAFEGRSITDLDGGAILQSAAIGSLSGGVGGATSKLAGRVVQSATKPANAFANGASKVATGAASGSLGGAAGGATNSAVTQLVETGTIDGGQVADAATTGLVTGGLGGAATGQVRANAASATLGSPRANPVFTSAQPGERAAAITGAAASTASSTVTKAMNSCEQSGNC